MGWGCEVLKPKWMKSEEAAPTYAHKRTSRHRKTKAATMSQTPAPSNPAGFDSDDADTQTRLRALVRDAAGAVSVMK
jgi:hypothetical protein